MKVAELINVLKSYNPEYEMFACSEEDLWQIGIGSFREATLHETANGDIVEPNDYNEEADGAITNTREALLIDLDL